MSEENFDNRENTGSQQPNINQQTPFMGYEPVPNSTAVLVLGILSIVTCFCYGIPGLIMGIIALVLSGKSNKLYLENPGLYTTASYGNMKAGRVCAIIGVSLSALYSLLVLIYLFMILFYGAAMSSMPWEEIFNQ
jgi:hypothetical protein